MANNDKSYSSVDQPDPKPGPFLAKVVSNIDPTYMGILEVEILRPVGGSSSEGQLHQVKYMSPFWGQVNVEYNSQNNDYNGTQKSYGMWMVPPDVGAIVMIVFIDGDPKRGYWMGCIPDENMDFMVPGLAATESVVEGPYTTALGDTAARVPVAEYNKIVSDNNSSSNSTSLLKPTHLFAKVLDAQGLILDDARGITTSSARREAPSMVFGISTPGPLDKQDGSPIGNYGKREHIVTGAPISRLGGTTFIMDDGDDKFLRKTAPTDGPPDYANVIEGDTSGDVTMPHNELFRIRTRTGHQILLHNSEDLIYITNSRGTAWIELTSDGKIDIYAQDSISVRTQNDLNFYADRDINIECGRNFNLKVAERHQTEIGGDKNTIVNGNVAIKIDGTHDEQITGATKITVQATLDVNATGITQLTSGSDLNINAGGNTYIKAANTAIDGGDINFNSGTASGTPTADTATPPDPLPTIDNPTEVDGNTLTSILARIPTTEPYPHHENLDATMFKPDATDREAATAIAVPPAWKTYSTDVDPFSRPPPLDPASEV
jgi:hypothetical protein